MTEKSFRPLRAGLLVAAAVLVQNAHAQERPDAGRLLQDTRPEQVEPTKPSVDFQPEGERLTEGEAGGAEVTLTEIRFSGNSVFDDKTLMAVLGEDVLGRTYDLAGLRALANRISRYYRSQGYPFARAVLPAQELDDGVLRIQVVEGRYGAVEARGEASLKAAAQGYLDALTPGDVIESDELERTALLLGDLPGVEVEPVMRPGGRPGTGDLIVGLREGPRVAGSVGLDNHGNRYSGEHRVRGEVRIRRLITVGDRLSLEGLYSNEDLWLGEIAYVRPLGYSGLEGELSFARTEYDLRAPYEGFTGTADVARAGARYPLLRSRRSNLILHARYVHKELDNAFDGTTYEDKSSSSWPVGLQFDHRDGLGRGGVTYGRLTVTPGDLETDVPGAIEGSFTKARLQAVRLQRLPGAFTLYGRVSAQWADSELDSSETFSLGGAGGVRAYPQGEATGSRAWLAQAELRYAVGAFTPYTFFDVGQITEFGDEPKRSLGGAGLGTRFDKGPWNAELAAAWKVWGGEPRSDDKDRSPRFWARLGYRF